MTLNNTTSLAVAELVIYILLFPIALCILWSHGKRGFLAYIYLVAFVVLRIVPAAMQISDYSKNKPESTVAAIIDSIGLGPLILCSSGILSEIQYYIHQGEQRSEPGKKLPLGTLIHICTLVGIVLSAYGGAKLVGSDMSPSDVSKYQKYPEAGSILILLAWLLLAFSASRFVGKIRSATGPSTPYLFVGALAALVPMFARTIYSVVAAFDHSPNVSPYTGYFALRLVMIFLMLLLAALCIIAGALISRNIEQEHVQPERIWSGAHKNEQHGNNV